MDCSYVLPAQPSSQREHPLSFMDMYFMPIDLLLVLPGQLDRQRLCNALAQTLSLYPPVSGCFLPPSSAWLGQPKLSLDEPVPIPIFWVERTGQSFSRDRWKEYLQRLDTGAIRKGQKVPLLKITVTSEGNQTVLGISFAHLLGDATAFYQFLQAWSDIYVSDPVSAEVIPQPVLDRLTFRLEDVARAKKDARAIPRRIAGRSQRLALTFTEKVLAYRQFAYTVIMRTLEYARFHLSAEAARILVTKVRQSPDASSSCSTQDALKGYLFRALNRYVYAEQQALARIITMVNARALRGLADRYFGNCLAVAETPTLSTSLTAPAIALKIRQSLDQLCGDKFRVGDRWLQEVQAVNGLTDVAPAFDADTLYVNDWTKNPFEQVSFGLESARFWQPLEVETLPVKNWCMIYRYPDPQLDGEGDKDGFVYEIQVAVPRGKAAALCAGVQTDVEDGFGAIL